MAEWPSVPLSAALEFKEGPGILAVDFRDTGTPLIRLAGVKHGASILDGCNYLDPDAVEKRWSQFRLRVGDVLLSTSASLGEVATVPHAGEGAIPYTGLIRFRPAHAGVAREYIPIALTSPSFARQIEAMGVGSVMRHFGPMHLRSMTVELPPLRDQLAIAEVLGALDDKIAANTRLAACADELVRAQWLRLAGQSGEARSLGQIASQSRSQVDPETVSGDLPYVGLEHIPRRLMWLSDLGEAATVNSAKSAFVKGDVLFGRLRPYFHKVAAAPVDGICSTDVLVLRATSPAMAGFLLAAATSDEVVAKATASSEGTRMPRVSWRDLAAVAIPWPGDEPARGFSEAVLQLRFATELRLREIQVLAATRDALLPALMSGKLRVRDAERLAEELT